MSYQMSRVRGTAEYRLQITRATTIEALSLWLGIEAETLMAANPDVSFDDLEAGQELIVPVSAFEADDELGERLLFGEWPPSVSVESTQEETEEKTVEVGPSGEEDVDPLAEDTLASDVADASEQDIDEAPTASGDGDTIEPDVPVPSFETESSEAGEAAPSTDALINEKTGYTVPEEPEPVTWRPFPKTVL